MWHDRRRAEDFTNIEHEISAGHRVEKHVFLSVKPPVVVVSRELVDDVHICSRRVMHEKAACGCTDKSANPRQNVIPGFRIQRAVIDLANQREQILVRIHTQAPPVSRGESPYACRAAPWRRSRLPGTKKLALPGGP